MKTKGDAELSDLLQKTRKELFTHRTAAAGSRPKDTDILKKSRKTIARVLTEQRARKQNAPTE
jgi:ribosomal protein L29